MKGVSKRTANSIFPFCIHQRDKECSPTKQCSSRLRLESMNQEQWCRVLRLPTVEVPIVYRGTRYLWFAISISEKVENDKSTTIRVHLISIDPVLVLASGSWTCSQLTQTLNQDWYLCKNPFTRRYLYHDTDGTCLHTIRIRANFVAIDSWNIPHIRQHKKYIILTF